MSRLRLEGPTLVVVGLVEAGLVAAVDCRQQNTVWTALMD